MADNNYTIPSEPLTREEEYLDAIVTNTASGGGGGKYVVDELTVTQNGTYTASGGVNAYNPVNVNVPNTYAAGDEGKVVSSGELVAQTARNITGAGTYDTTTNNSVTVSEPEPVQEKDVNFYDYDGTVLYSYTAQEFLALTEMPANPDRTSEGLTAQGWNWSFADAVDYVTDYGMLDVGQMYVTTDGATKLFITLTDGRLSPYLGFALTGTATIDWGDNSTQETVTGSSWMTVIYTPHTYTNVGDYVISITPTTGSGITFRGESNYYSSILRKSSSPNAINDYSYLSCLKKVYLGNDAILADRAFFGCSLLQNISIPNSTTGIYNGAFQNCSSLTTIIISNNITAIQANAFQGCTLLRNVVLNSTTTISMNAFRSCSNLKRCLIQNNTTSIWEGTFMDCYHLDIFLIPNSMTTIGGGAFQNCQLLKSIIITSNITQIEYNAFRDCRSMKTIKFEPTSPPTVGNNAFTNLPTDCIIYVPSGSLTAYTTASNYPDPTVYTYIEY